MSSTSAAGARTSLASSEPSNAPSLPSVSPGFVSSTPSSANTATPLTLVTTSPPSLFTSAPVTTLASSKSQQPSSASRTTMSSSTVATTTAPTSASLSVSSSPIPTTSAMATPMSSSPSSVATTTSSNDTRSTTSTPESSAQSTTPLATTTSTTTQSSALASPLTTADPSSPASSTPISTVVSASNAPSSSSSSPSILTSQSPSPTRVDMPLTTVLESTTVYITSTNSQGQVVTSVPPVVTEVITTTGSGGVATTVTQAIVNPTLAPDNNSTEGSSFFTDTGAVVGVFVVVGLASASIAMWILFAIRRRQRMRRIEQDTVIEAAVAAAGFNRAPLDDDDEADSPTSPDIRRRVSSGMGQRTTLLGSGGSDTLPTSAQPSDTRDDLPRNTANSHPRGSMDHRSSSHPEGYVPARTTSPLPRGGRFTDDFASSRDRKSSYGHTPTYSAGSFEPLLANYAQNTSDQDASTTEPPRSRSLPHVDNGLGSNEHPDGSPENRPKPRQNSSDSSVLRDENDYANYVLMVRNLPDDQSQHST